MFVTTWIEVQNKPAAVVVPFNAMLYDENRPYVFVIDDTNIARRRNIVPGIQGLAGREILSGVKASERLAIDGRHRLVEGAPVRVVNVDESTEPPITVGTSGQ